LIDAIIADIRTQTTLSVLTSDFKVETLPAHHFMNFKVIDEHGRQLDMGRNLATLQAELGGQARQSFQKMAEGTAHAAVVVTPQGNKGKPGAPVTVATGAGQAGKAGQAAPAGKAAGAAPNAAHTGLTSWTFGELPELLEIVQGKLTLIGFPALVDKGTHCDIEVFDDPTVALRTHRIGMRRLFALQFKDQLKFIEKNIPNMQQMGMQFMAMGSQEELRDQIIQKAIEMACLQDPLPLDAAAFNKRKEEGKSRLGLLVNETARLLSQVLTEFHGLPKKLQGVQAATAADMQAQLQGLVHKRFLADNEYAQLAHFPRYLKAMNVRLEKLRADPARDAKLMAEWNQAASLYLRAMRDRQAGKNTDPKLVEFRWMLEELRVSLFAQELRTPMPVSVKRLQKVWESMQR
jgi:ATP-dependent helicase HrpA